VAAQAKFKAKYGLQVPLLSDPERKLLGALGALTEKEPGKSKIVRSTFVFDQKGKLVNVYPSVKVDGHAEQVLADLG
jgi:peroxiredoxin Q/BCP